MKLRSLLLIKTIAVVLAALATRAATSSQDRYTLTVPNGLAFAEFKGYEKWQFISLSNNSGKLAVILGNPAMIDAYKAGIPDNGKPFPDGAKMAKIHWIPKTNETYPGRPVVPGTQHDVDFMAKDSKRFADSGGWGYAEFEYDAASDTFRPGDMTDQPPQGNDAKCGFACHTAVKARDYVFTEYPVGNAVVDPASLRALPNSVQQVLLILSLVSASSVTKRVHFSYYAFGVG